MAKYLIKVSYSAHGMKGVMAEGATSRVDTIRELIAGVGGTMECFHFAFGGTDVYLVVEMPDTATAVAFAATIGSSDAISSYETVVLIDPADVDAAASVAVGYRAPGA